MVVHGLATRAKRRLEREWDYWKTWRESRFLRRLEAPSPASGTALIVSMSNRSIAGKSLGLLARRLQMEGLRPVVVTSRYLTNAIRVYRLLGVEQFELLDPAGVKPRVEFTNGLRLSTEMLLDLRYRGVAIGRTALNTATRERFLGSLDFTDAAICRRVCDLLALSAGMVDELLPLLERLAPQMALFQPDRGYSPTGELFGACLQLGIPTVQVSSSQRPDALVLKRYSSANEFDSPHSLSDATWADVLAAPWSGHQDREIMELLVSAYENASWYSHIYDRPDSRTDAGGELRRRFGIDGERRIGVVFPHILWDAAFFYGRVLFPNYEEWLLETVRAAGRTSDMDWIVRLHPAYVTQQKLAKGSDRRDLRQFRQRLGRVPENVHFIEPEDELSALALLRTANVCVTGQGTIGIEAPCHGVPTLTAATGRYSGRGFTIDSATPAQYLERVAGADRIPPLDAATVTRARRFAHAVFLRRPWSFTSFEVTRRPLRRLGHPLDRNLRLQLSTAEEFLAAEDLRRFVDWVVGSDAEDYLE